MVLLHPPRRSNYWDGRFIILLPRCVFPRIVLARRVSARRVFPRRVFLHRALARRALFVDVRCASASFVEFISPVIESKVASTTFVNFLHYNCPCCDTNLNGECLDQCFFALPQIALLEPTLPSLVNPWYTVNRRACSLVRRRIYVLAFCVVPHCSVSVTGYGA